jgi:hypothetical protein
MMSETPGPLQPFDELDRANLELAGFSIADDNRRRVRPP